MKKFFCRWCQSDGADPDALHPFCRPHFVEYRRRLADGEQLVLSDDYWFAKIGREVFRWLSILAQAEEEE